MASMGEMARTSPGAMPAGIGLGEIAQILWRRKLLILGVFVGMIALAFVFMKVVTPTFRSNATVILGVRPDAFVNLNQAQLPESDAVTRSELDVLKSDQLMAEVVISQGLMDDPEFNPTLTPFAPNWLTRAGFAEKLPSFIRPFFLSVPPDPAALAPSELLFMVARQLNRAYDVTLDAKSLTIQILVTSVDPVKSARIANAIAEQYLKDQLDLKFQTTQRASAFIDNKLIELRRAVDGADRAVQEYRERNGIVDLPQGGPDNTLTVSQLETLSNDLANARTSRAQADAALREARALVNDPDRSLSSPAIAGLPSISTLKAQYASQSAEVAKLKATLGEKHPELQRATAQLVEIRNQLRSEVSRAIQTLSVAAQQAATQEGNIQARIAQLEKATHIDSRALVRLHQLESEQRAARSVFEAYLAGASKTSVDNGVPMPEARLAARALVPATPSFPQLPIVLAIAIVLGGMLSLLAVFVVESRDGAFRLAGDLEAQLGLPVLAMVPRLRRRRADRRQHVSFDPVVNANTPFAEALRTLRARLAMLDERVNPKVLLISSALSNEGKTALSLSIIRQTALGGKRALLIECELRRPSVIRDLDLIANHGVADVLEGRMSLEQAVTIDPLSAAHMLVVTEPSRFPHEVLTGEALRDLIAEARGAYDLVVIDTPPLHLFADALLIADLADAGLLAVRWGVTPRALVEDAARRLREASKMPIGVVLNQVDFRRNASYGSGADPSRYVKEYFSTSTSS